MKYRHSSLYNFSYSKLWYWIVWFADIALLLLPSIEEPFYFKNVPRWVAILIELLALTILFISFFLSMQLQDKRKLLKGAVYPYIFVVVFLVKILIEKEKQHCWSLFQLTLVDLVIYYPLVYNGHKAVRWSRPLRILFPLSLQSGQHVWTIGLLIETLSVDTLF